MGIPRELGGTIIGFIILFVAAGRLYQENISRLRDWYARRSNRSLKGDKGAHGRIL
jgi:hypothetical protein